MIRCVCFILLIATTPVFYGATNVLAGTVIIEAPVDENEISSTTTSRSTTFSAVIDDNRNCQCFNDDCGCCEYLNWPKLGFNGTGKNYIFTKWIFGSFWYRCVASAREIAANFESIILRVVLTLGIEKYGY